MSWGKASRTWGLAPQRTESRYHSHGWYPEGGVVSRDRDLNGGRTSVSPLYASLPFKIDVLTQEKEAGAPSQAQAYLLWQERLKIAEGSWRWKYLGSVLLPSMDY